MNCNAIKVIEGMQNKINPRFDASVKEFQDIARAYPDKLDLVSAAFIFGYAQGQKAERARRKKNE